MIEDDKEFIDLPCDASVLEAEDVDEDQVPHQPLRLSGHPDCAKDG